MNGLSARDVPTENREFDVPRALSRLEKQCAEVEVTFDSLLTRLEGVTHPAPPSTGKGEAIRVTAGTRMGERIDTTTVSLQRLQSAMQDLLHRLEV